MNKIEIYSKDWCPFCSKAKSLLQSKQLDYAEIDITTDRAREQEMIERSGRRTVPQVFIDGDAIGGYDDLANINATGELDQRLNLAPADDLDKVYDVVVVGERRDTLNESILPYDLGSQIPWPDDGIGMRARELCGALGAEARDVDLNRLGKRDAAAIRDAFHDHLVLVFRDQDLTAAAQVELTEMFGPVEPHPLRTRRSTGCSPAGTG